VLGTCVTHIFEIQAALLQVPLDSIEVDVRGTIDPRGGHPGHEATPIWPHNIQYEVQVASSASDAQLNELFAAVEKNCPILNLLRNPSRSWARWCAPSRPPGRSPCRQGSAARMSTAPAQGRQPPVPAPTPAWQPDTVVLHAGYDGLQHQRSAAVPIYQTTSFLFEDAQHGAELFDLVQEGHIYARTGNPTQTVLEQRIARLEGGTAALAVASGMAAIDITLATLARAGDHVILASALYGGSTTWSCMCCKAAALPAPWWAGATTTPCARPSRRRPRQCFWNPWATLPAMSPTSPPLPRWPMPRAWPWWWTTPAPRPC
jgi:hypothetical protein